MTPSSRSTTSIVRLVANCSARHSLNGCLKSASLVLAGSSKFRATPRCSQMATTSRWSATRRAVMCTMDPGVERPELRVFNCNPLEMVRADRDKYVIAVLTILRAFHLAGRPVQISPLGSFSEWSSWIRDALIWLGEADPCETMEKVRQNDPKLGAVIVISQWADVIGYDKRVTTKDLIDYAIPKIDEGYPVPYSKQEFAHPELREALLIVAG